VLGHRNYGEFLAERIEKLLTDPDGVIPEPLGPGNLLGKFVRSNNTKTPAINVGQTPSDWAVSGLQVIIGMLPASAVSQHSSNPDGYGVVREIGNWPVTLRQFPTAQANPLIKSEQQEMLESTIERAHSRLLSWCQNIQMRTVADNTKATVYVEAVYLIPYEWTMRTPLGVAGPYV
jgi:hypothetical protein